MPRPDDVGHAPWHQEGSQPPLYYLSAALLTKPISTANAGEIIRYNPHAAIGQADSFGNQNMMAHGPAEAWPWRGVALAAHVARFFSIFLGALTVFFTYLIGRTVFPSRPAISLGAALLVAFNPQFLFLSGAVNNDNLVTMTGAAGVLLAVTALGRRDAEGGQGRPGWGLLVLMGVIAGVAMLSKLSGLFVPVIIGFALSAVAWRRRSWREWLIYGLTTGGIAATDRGLVVCAQPDALRRSVGAQRHVRYPAPARQSADRSRAAGPRPGHLALRIGPFLAGSTWWWTSGFMRSLRD